MLPFLAQISERNIIGLANDAASEAPASSDSCEPVSPDFSVRPPFGIVPTIQNSDREPAY